MAHSPPRAVLYARVSTVLQENADAQLGELRRVAAARGWTIAAELVEQASGADRQRPRLAEALATIHDGRANLLAAVALDRITRSVSHLIELVEDLEACGAELVCHRDGNLDTTTPQGRAFVLVRGIFAELERGLACERAREFAKERAAQGLAVGRPRLLVGEQAKDARAMAGALRLAGVSWRQVAAQLRRRGVKASPRTIRRWVCGETPPAPAAR